MVSFLRCLPPLLHNLNPQSNHLLFRFSNRAPALHCTLAVARHTAGRSRETLTSDALDASTTLETLSRSVCSLAPFVLDAQHPKAERWATQVPFLDLRWLGLGYRVTSSMALGYGGVDTLYFVLHTPATFPIAQAT